MKRASRASLRTEWANADTLLRWAMVSMGIPASLMACYCLLFGAYPRTQTVQLEVARSIERHVGTAFDTAAFREMETRLPDFAAQDWQPATLPASQELPPASAKPDHAEVARVWYRLRFHPTAQREQNEPYALYGTRVMGGAFVVRTNGHTVFSNDTDWHMQWNRPTLVLFSPNEFAGQQVAEIYLGIPYLPAQGYALGSLYVGPVGAVRYWYELRYFLQQTLPGAGLVFALLLGILSGHFWFARQSETPLLLLAFASAAWNLCNLQYLVDFDNVIVARWFAAIDDAAMGWAVLLSYLFAFRVANLRFPWLERSLIVYMSAITIITLPIWNWQMSALVLQHCGDLVIAIGMLILFLFKAPWWRSTNVAALAFALASIVFFGGHDLWLLTSQRYPDSIHLFPYTVFLLFGAFMHSMQRRHLDALDSVEELNASLYLRLQQRERELELQHRQLREVELKQTLLLEQQRMNREMHDGVGFSLNSALVLAQNCALPPERVTQVLHDCLDELKMVIESQEPDSLNPGDLLANVRGRIGERLEDAGLRIAWDVEDLPDLPWFEPSHALNLVRIVQESLTNVLKHARARVVRLGARLGTAADGEPAIVITVADDGTGTHALAQGSGKGRRSMAWRAQCLNAELRIEAHPGRGTTVELAIPLAPPQSARSAGPPVRTEAPAAGRDARSMSSTG